MNNGQLEIYFLSALSVLGGVVAYLFRLLWSVMQSRLRSQDRMIEMMKEEIARLNRGCGHPQCLWNNEHKLSATFCTKRNQA